MISLTGLTQRNPQFRNVKDGYWEASIFRNVLLSDSRRRLYWHQKDVDCEVANI